MTCITLTCFALLYSPGRFFAADELKALLAHIVVNYDLKLDDSSGGSNGATNVMDSRIMIRKRKTD